MLGAALRARAAQPSARANNFPTSMLATQAGLSRNWGMRYSGFIGTSLQAYEISELGRWGKLHVGLACVRSTLKSGANEKYAGYS